MNISGIISGIVIGFFGVYLLIVGFITSGGLDEAIIALFFGIAFLGIGIYMLFHLRNEDEIEKVTYKKSVSSKK